MWLSTLQSLERPWISVCNNGCWSIDPRKLKTDLFDLITNPDKFDECDPDHILPLSSSDYYSVAEMNSTLFHCNIRSLPRNLSLLHDILYCLDSRPNNYYCNFWNKTKWELSFKHWTPPLLFLSSWLAYCSRWSRT